MEIWHDDIIRPAVGGNEITIWELADFERAAKDMTIPPVMWLWGLQCRPWWRTLYRYDCECLRRGCPESTPAKIIAMPEGKKRDELAAAWMRRLRTTVREVMQNYKTWPEVQRAILTPLADNTEQEKSTGAHISECIVAVLGFLWTLLACVVKLTCGLCVAVLQILFGVLSALGGGKRKRRR